MARSDDAIERIRELIVSGDLGPGDRLPPENQLCELLGMSRGSMREAVKSLAVAGVLDVRRGDGTYVTSLEPGLLLQGLGRSIQLLGDGDLGDVMHIRRVLEGEASALAARQVGPELLDELVGDLERMRAAADADDTEALVSHDAAFHDRVAAASANRTLATLLSELSSLTLRARIWRGLQEEGAHELTLRQHQAILDALIDGDAEAARAASTVHVATSERWFRRVAADAVPADTPANGNPT